MFSSAKSEQELSELVANTEADGFIRKTMNPGDFLSQVGGFLSAAEARQPNGLGL